MVIPDARVDEVVRELDSISYDLFDKVSCRMGLFRMDRTKTEIREIQARLDKLKWRILDQAIAPTGDHER